MKVFSEIAEHVEGGDVAQVPVGEVGIATTSWAVTWSHASLGARPAAN